MRSIYERTMPANFTSGWLGNGELPGTDEGVVTDGTLPREKRLKLQTHYLLLRNESFSFPSLCLINRYRRTYRIQAINSSLELSEQTPKILGVVSKQYEIVQNDCSFGWRSSSEKRSTWMRRRTCGRSQGLPLPPHSVVRRRTSSLATQSNDASLAT